MLLDGEPDPIPFLPRLPHRASPDLRQAATIGPIGTFAPPMVLGPPAVEGPRRRGRVALIALVGLALRGGVGFYVLRARGSTSAEPAVTPTGAAATAAAVVHIDTASFWFVLAGRPVAEERPTSSADEDVPANIWTIQIGNGTLQVLAYSSNAALDEPLTQAKVDRVVSRLAGMSGSIVAVNEPDGAVSTSARRIILQNHDGRTFIEVLSTPDRIVLVSQGGGNDEITPAYAALLGSFRFR